jgi:G patch domain-containing protein 1
MRELGMSIDDEEDAEDDEEAKKHTFAPIDRTVLTFDNKENQWGLGYVPGQSLTERLQEQHSSQSGSYSVPTSDRTRFGSARNTGDAGPQSRVPMGGAFGISALEEPDEDDLDVYGGDSSEHRNLVINEEEDEDYGIPGIRAKNPELLRKNDRQRKGLETPRPPETASATQNQTFSDGTPMLRGFVLASRLQPPDKW